MKRRVSRCWPSVELLEERRLLAVNVLTAELQIVDGETLVSRSSDWRYLDDGSNQQTAWREPAFDDSLWASDPAELGYGDGDEATEVSFGGDPGNKFITTYFRRSFELTNVANLETLELSVIRDDGVAVYLNGAQVMRDSLATDALFDDPATQTIANADEAIPVVQSIDVASLPAGTLVEGTNVLAAEIHQSSGTSSDLSFDLSLARPKFLGFFVDVDAEVDVATLDAADLLVDGQAIAIEASLVDADSIVFQLPLLRAGVHSFALGEGSLASVGGESLAAYSGDLTIAAAKQFSINQPPRLQPGNAPLAGYAGSDLDQVDLLWQTIPAGTGTDDSFTVEYRLVASNQPWIAAGAVASVDTGDGGRAMHSSNILDLEWNSEYEYRVEHWRGDVVVSTYQHAFRTRLQAGDNTPFRFVAYGDSAEGNATGFRGVQSRINTLDPNFAVLLGDNIYFNGSYDQADSRFDPTINPEAATWTAGHVDYLGLGNHDVATDEGGPSELMFSVPIPEAGVNAPAEPPASEHTEQSFSWDYGNVHFVTFVTTEWGTHNSIVDRDRLDGLLDYVVADLQASDAQWKIVYGHHPLAGAPEKPENPGDYYYQQVVERLTNAGADLFLAGHSHMYHWTYPLTGQINGEATFVDGPYNAFESNRGLPQLVSGVGGQSLRNGDYSPYPFVAAGFSQTTAVKSKNGFAQIDVTPDQLTLSYIGADDGQVIDAFTLTAAQDNQAPTVRLASPIDDGPRDLDPAIGDILLNSAEDQFLLDLLDVGDGIDDATVDTAAFTLMRNGSPLVNPADYTFTYDAALNRVALVSTTGGFGDGIYAIGVNQDAGIIMDHAGNVLTAMRFELEIDTTRPGPTIVSFQQGVDGYFGTYDTFLAEDDPMADHSTTAVLEVDLENINGPTQTLLRFEDIFGMGNGQIPPDATILSATLALEVTNAGDGISFHQLLQLFADTDNWDTWGDGIQANNVEAIEASAPRTGSFGTGSIQIDVRTALRNWLAAPAINRGWALLPTGTNGVDFDSSEGAMPPRLTVRFTTPMLDTLFVEAIEPSPAGATVNFSRAIDVSALNLFGGQMHGSAPADVLLVGDVVGPVRGSVIWRPETAQLVFIASGGPLVADTYTLTLASRPDGLVDPDGELLDGDADNVPGGDYVTHFTVDIAFGRVIQIPDFARGAGQDIELLGTGGIPISIDEAEDLTQFSLQLNFDPNLLSIVDAVLGEDLNGWSADVDLSMPGTVLISANGPSLPAGPADLIVLEAGVPAAAPAQRSAILQLSDVSLNGSTLAATADHGMMVTALLGDATGDGTYSGLDASLIARMAVGLDDGLDSFPLIDPILISDVTGNGGLSALDASFVARKAVGLPQPEIPDLPLPTPMLQPPPLERGAATRVAPVSGTELVDAALAAWDLFDVASGGIDDEEFIKDLFPSNA